ncbi:3-hydroxyacyl-CoA dehydrogenase NAD-binding domain-containing protein [Marinobacteraceae bacterium S3BR75-40.1]
MTGKILQALTEREMDLGPLDTEGGTVERNWEHWSLGWDRDNIAWLVLDQKDKRMNVLSQAVIQELGGLVEKLKGDPPKGLVIRSAKPAGFCAGADIAEFQDVTSEEQVIEQLNAGHAVLDDLENLPFPTVAVLHGPCLGGGLEVALSCNYRLALPGASLGFPEIQLGLHPGLGGTARLTHLIDPIEAMTLMLTGKTVHTGKARSLVIVDDVIEERHVSAAVRATVDGKLDNQENGLRGRILTNYVARQFEARQMRSQSAKKAPPQHYPAPEALISLWENHGGDTSKMRREEAKSFANLMMTDTAQNLIRVFFLREKLKGLTKAEDGHKPQTLHVIGAGEMGGDIAGWSAYKGLRVSLFDMEPQKVAQAVAKLTKLCEKKGLSDHERRDVLDRLTPDLANHGIDRADLVIEAVPEDINIKKKVYDEVEPRLKEGAVLATNTSSIPLEQLGNELKDARRLVGLHFFNPVAKMPLVEVVNHEKADESYLATGRQFVGAISRLPAPVRSAPGFLVNRALMPYLTEALLMVDEGIAADAIDDVATDFGMPMGPVELADQVGLDICLSVADMLQERLDTPMPDVPDWLRQKVEDGELGKKTGKGLYAWKDGKPYKKGKGRKPPEDATDRLLLPMLNACMACLREQVIEDEDSLDGCMIFGTGFAPFRGGPMKYARDRGFGDIADALSRLADRYGDRFKPDEGWSQ